MRWDYADWVEPESDLKEKLEKKDKSLLLESAEGFPKSGYIKIENEYIRYSSKSGNKLKGLSRGYKSSASDHAKGDNAKLEYKYKGGSWERVTKVINVDKKKKDWYKKKKVLVTNSRNGKKVVASILESGPAIWTGRVGGLSPESYEAIGAKTNENCTFQYVDEKTDLGPVD
jgi:rare lipoprotein A (peptidoglycan hydrolase)